MTYTHIHKNVYPSRTLLFLNHPRDFLQTMQSVQGNRRVYRVKANVAVKRGCAVVELL